MSEKALTFSESYPKKSDVDRTLCSALRTYLKRKIVKTLAREKTFPSGVEIRAAANWLAHWR